MKKLPPHNNDYEKSILAGCILFSECRETAIDLLNPEDFYRTAHQIIFRAVKYLSRKREPVDLATVKTCIEKYTDLKNIGGAAALAELLDHPVPTHTEHYCRKVKELSSARKMISICNDVSRACYEPGADYGEVLDKAQNDILAVNFGPENNFTSMADLSDESLERYEAVWKGESDPGIRTGFSEIDIVTGGGFKGSKLIIIAARPRIGKTALMLNMVRFMAQSGHSIGIFSIEMDKEELDDRFTSMLTGINTLRLTSGKGLQERQEWDRVTLAAEQKASWRVWLDDGGGLAINELRRRSRQLKKMGVEIIFIDQLSKIRGGQGRSEYEERTDIVNQIAQLKKELRMPVVLLAQVNRKIEDRTSKAPTLGDLKSTGSLEEDADIVLLGHRPYEYDKKKEDPTFATWEVAKNRGGPERICQMRWEKKTTTFKDVAPQTVQHDLM